jgi:uncharacterized surface protein with fasciclin (FAS1) repeats
LHLKQFLRLKFSAVQKIGPSQVCVQHANFLRGMLSSSGLRALPEQEGSKMLFSRPPFTAIAVCLGLAMPACAPAGQKDIVDTAVSAGQFETLAAAVCAADLVGTLKGDGPFTVFAPTDAAFAALPEGTVETLLKPENREQLTQILTYHVVPGKVMSSDLSDGMTAATVMGKEITVSMNGGVKINDATVTAADIETSNGVIHVVDTVILP